MTNNKFEKCTSQFNMELNIHPERNFNLHLSFARSYTGSHLGLSNNQKKILHKIYKDFNFNRINEIYEYAKKHVEEYPWKDYILCARDLEIEIKNNKDIFTKVYESIINEELNGGKKKAIIYAIYTTLRKIKLN